MCVILVTAQERNTEENYDAGELLDLKKNARAMERDVNYDLLQSTRGMTLHSDYCESDVQPISIR